MLTTGLFLSDPYWTAHLPCLCRKARASLETEGPNIGLSLAINLSVSSSTFSRSLPSSGRPFREEDPVIQIHSSAAFLPNRPPAASLGKSATADEDGPKQPEENKFVPDCVCAEPNLPLPSINVAVK